MQMASNGRARLRPVIRARPSTHRLERVMGIEPTSSAWEAEVLPLNYTRSNQLLGTRGEWRGKAFESLLRKALIQIQGVRLRSRDLDFRKDIIEAASPTPFLATRPSSLATNQLYMFSITSPYASTTFARLIFRVGVSRPFSMVQGCSRGVTRRMRA